MVATIPLGLNDFGLAIREEWFNGKREPRTNGPQYADDASGGRCHTASTRAVGQSTRATRSAGTRRRAAVLVGVCALIFQASWFREFRLVFGASTAASSAVLAVFMGGLGIGNAVLGKRADRARSPLALYALLELAIALAAALSPLVIDVLHGLYISMGGQLAIGFPVATAVRLAISALVLGIPTFLMGGTLPAAVRAVTVCEDHQRRGAALLYGVNTLGAVVGALGSTFFALEFFGTRKTLWLACLINIGTALSALALSRYAVRRGGPASMRPIARNAARTKTRTANEQVRPPSFPAYIVYGVAGIVGFAFFLMELVWYRMLCPILGGTTFTFGLILAVALTGIGLGAAAYAMFFRRGRSRSTVSPSLASWRRAASRFPSPWAIAWRFWQPRFVRPTHRISWAKWGAGP